MCIEELLEMIENVCYLLYMKFKQYIYLVFVIQKNEVTKGTSEDSNE